LKGGTNPWVLGFLVGARKSRFCQNLMHRLVASYVPPGDSQYPIAFRVGL